MPLVKEVVDEPVPPLVPVAAPAIAMIMIIKKNIKKKMVIYPPKKNVNHENGFKILKPINGSTKDP
jgi:hypothetical protein